MKHDRSSSVISECTKFSLDFYNQHVPPGFECSYDYCFKELHKNSSQFFRTMHKEDGELIGWFLAAEGCLFPFSQTKVLNLRIYYTSLTGYSAVKALIFVHKQLEIYAKTHNLKFVSTSSFLNTKEVFIRILEDSLDYKNYGGILIKEV